MRVSSKVVKAILPVAGRGTRLMPLTMHQPKEMVGIVDQPMINYAIRELLALGIKELYFIISPQKTMLREYINSLNLSAKVHFVMQKEPRGNADAVYKAAPYVKNQPVAVSFCDDVLLGGPQIMKEALGVFKKYNAPVLVLERVPKSLVHQYGVVKAIKRKDGKKFVYEIKDIVEKPKPHQAPSNLASIGRYILTPELFAVIKKTYAIKTEGEIALADAIRLYLKNGGKVYAVEFKGGRFDCGSKLGLMKAQIFFGLAHPELGRKLTAFLKSTNGHSDKFSI